jgi:hypothetical protein
MKTINIPKKCVECYRCNKKIYAITYPQGADYISCPLCASYIEPSCVSDSDSDIDLDYSYCQKCKIVFKSGCTHAVNGCTDDIYYAQFLYETHDNDKIKGPIIVESEEQAIFFLKSKTCKFIWVCMCDGDCTKNQCEKAYYPNYPGIECCKTNLSNTSVIFNEK